MNVSNIKFKKSSLIFLAIGLVTLIVGTFVLGNKEMFFDIRPRASKNLQTITGTLVKNGTPQYGPCKMEKGKYALLEAVPDRVTKDYVRGSCTPLVVNTSKADPFVNKKVITTGVFKDGTFYVTDLATDGGMGIPVPKPTFISKPIPTSCQKSSDCASGYFCSTSDLRCYSVKRD